MMDELIDFAPKRDSLYKQVADQIQELVVADSPLSSGLLTGKRESGLPEGSRMSRDERTQERFTRRRANRSSS